MSDTEKDDKTEQASEYRIQQAYQEGKSPKSQEIISLAAIASLSIALFVSSREILFQMFIIMRSFFDIGLDSSYIQNFDFVWDILGLFILLIIPITILSLIVQFAQVGFIFNFKALTPDINRINPLKNIKSLFQQMPFEFIKVLVKLFFISAIIGLLLHSSFIYSCKALINGSFPMFISILQSMIFKIIACIVLIVSIIATFDYISKKAKFLQDMMTTKKEAKDEMKQQSVNPEIKAKMKRNIMAIINKNKKNSKAIEEAAFTINNPEHYCIAIGYGKKYEIPTILAKEIDESAVFLKNLAIKAKKPRIHSPKIVRAIYYNCEEGKPIDKKYYDVIAQIIIYLQSINFQDKDIDFTSIQNQIKN